MVPSKPAARPVAKKPVVKAPVAKASAARPAGKKPATRKPAAKAVAPTAASSAAVDAYFVAQKPNERALLDRLRAVVLKAIPDAQPALKWGAPFYLVNGKNITSMAAFKEHVSINFFAPPEVLIDPTGRL